ncbi:hypothetical protein, partial [Thiohalocapsa sp.]|uniref:hypothetical protein n=1 Tax=Thiohalocapsa sp. TaxID=2497641 RepID=UPI0025E754DB
AGGGGDREGDTRVDEVRPAEAGGERVAWERRGRSGGRRGLRRRRELLDDPYFDELDWAPPGGGPSGQPARPTSTPPLKAPVRPA